TSEEERAAMSQLAASNPQPSGASPNGREAMYQRITRGERPRASTPVWRRLPVAIAGLAVVAVVAVASFAMLSGGNGAGDSDAVIDPGIDPGGGFATTCIGYSEDELRLREYAF